MAETQNSKQPQTQPSDISSQSLTKEETHMQDSKQSANAETTGERLVASEKMGSMPVLEREYLMDFTEVISSALSEDVEEGVAELSEELDIQQYYRPWAAMHILGIEEDQLVRFVFADRDRKDGEMEYEGIWIDASTGKEKGVRGRRRIFGMRNLERIVLNHAALVNAKPAHDDYVAVDAIKMFDTFGNRLGWGAWETRGVHMENCSNLPKRLNTLFRDAFLAAVYDNNSIEIDVVSHSDLCEYGDEVDGFDDKMLDGCTAISMSFFIRQNEFAFEQARLDYNSIEQDATALVFAQRLQRKHRDGYVEFMKSKSDRIWRRVMRSRRGQFRMINRDGLWKGDYVVSEHDHLEVVEDGAVRQVDIRSFYKNCKPELRWTEGTYVHLEPHPHKPDQIVYTDEQTHSWLLRKIFTPDQLATTLRDLNGMLLEELKVGIIPDHIRKWSESRDEDEDDSETPYEAKGQISNLQHVIHRYSRGGFNINSSRHIIRQLGQGHINMLNSSRKGRRFPLPGAARYGIASNAWLRMAEYEGIYVDQGCGQYVPEIQSFVINDRDVVKLYARLGGFDFDDHIVAILCEVERSGRKIWIIYRSPNNYGEYAILNYVEGTEYPTWIVDRGPNKVTLSKLPKVLEQVSPTFDSLPEPAVKDPIYDIDAVKQVITELAGARQIGIWANAQIVHMWTNDCPRENPLCPTEFVADACMKDRDPNRVQLVCDDIEATMEELKAGLPINRDLWADRIRRPMNINDYQYTDRGERAVLRVKFNAAVTEFENQVKIIASKAGEKILPLLDFVWAPHTEEKSKKFRDFYGSCIDARNAANIELNHDQWNMIAARTGEVLNNKTTEERVRMLLHTAWVKYSTHNSDQLLFQFNRKSKHNVIDFYIEALQFGVWRQFVRNIIRHKMGR